MMFFLFFSPQSPLVGRVGQARPRRAPAHQSPFRPIVVGRRSLRDLVPPYALRVCPQPRIGVGDQENVGLHAVKRDEIIVPPWPMLPRSEGNQPRLDRELDAGGAEDLANQQVLGPGALRQPLRHDRRRPPAQEIAGPAAAIAHARPPLGAHVIPASQVVGGQPRDRDVGVVIALEEIIPASTEYRVRSTECPAAEPERPLRQARVIVGTGQTQMCRPVNSGWEGVGQPSRKTDSIPAASASAIQVARQRCRRSEYFQPLKAPIKIFAIIVSPSGRRGEREKGRRANLPFSPESMGTWCPPFSLSSFLLHARISRLFLPTITIRCVLGRHASGHM